jgi:hypothetical protein
LARINGAREPRQAGAIHRDQAGFNASALGPKLLSFSQAGKNEILPVRSLAFIGLSWTVFRKISPNLCVTNHDNECRDISVSGESFDELSNGKFFCLEI